MTTLTETTIGGTPLPPPTATPRESLSYGLTLDPDEQCPLVNAYDPARRVNVFTGIHTRSAKTAWLFVEGDLPEEIWTGAAIPIPEHMAEAMAPLLWQFLETPPVEAGPWVVQRDGKENITREWVWAAVPPKKAKRLSR